MDTEIGCFIELEVAHATPEVFAGVQGRGGPARLEFSGNLVLIGDQQFHLQDHVRQRWDVERWQRS